MEISEGWGCPYEEFLHRVRKFTKLADTNFHLSLRKNNIAVWRTKAAQPMNHSAKYNTEKPSLWFILAIMSAILPQLLQLSFSSVCEADSLFLALFSPVSGVLFPILSVIQLFQLTLSDQSFKLKDFLKAAANSST